MFSQHNYMILINWIALPQNDHATTIRTKLIFFFILKGSKIFNMWLHEIICLSAVFISTAVLKRAMLFYFFFFYV
jgi:hypothetical protein